MHPFQPNANLAEVRMLCDLIQQEGASGSRGGRGSELAREILSQLATGSLDDAAYARLQKWCEMANREEVVEGHFRQIARRLYGRSLSRV
jgi:hypothetical protein